MASWEPTASVECTIPFVVAANKHGVDTKDLIRRADLRTQVLQSPGARVSSAVLARLIQQAADLSDDGHFGLHAAQGIGVSTVEVLSYMAQSSLDFESFLSYASELFPLVNSCLDFHLERDGALGRWWGRYKEGVPGFTHHKAEYYLHGFLIILRRAVGRDFRPTHIWFPHSPKSDVSEHERLFGVVPEFGKERLEIGFDSDWLDSIVSPKDPLVCSAVRSYADGLNGVLPAPETFSDRVRGAIASKMGDGLPTRDEVAAYLGLSGRTLQRRLNDEGRSYRELLDHVRRVKALLYVERGELTAAEVGYRLGFSEPSAFHRAFRRWTGTSPRHYLLRPRGDSSSPDGSVIA